MHRHSTRARARNEQPGAQRTHSTLLMRHYAAIIAGIQFGTCESAAALSVRSADCALCTVQIEDQRERYSSVRDSLLPSPLLSGPSPFRLRSQNQRFACVHILNIPQSQSQINEDDKIDNPSERICVRITFPADAAERVGATSSTTRSNKGRSFSSNTSIRATVAAVAGIRLTGDACRKNAD